MRENVWFYLLSCLHLLFFAAKQRSIYVPFVFSVICPLTVWISHGVGSPTFSHTPINLCIDSHLHFYTVWAELKQDDSFRCVHCFPHAPVVYNEIGVLQTTSAQLRNWMYSAQCVVHGSFRFSSPLWGSCACVSPTSFCYSWWSSTTVFPCRINFISL